MRALAVLAALAAVAAAQVEPGCDKWPMGTPCRDVETCGFAVVGECFHGDCIPIRDCSDDPGFSAARGRREAAWSA
ncbi:hypothetical protein CDD83_6354 [Cordyceps sp. RAO-2017]|nr:hypothetical protein CDD83_6354 [Cordyceps sp. RAO-2017]